MSSVYLRWKWYACSTVALGYKWSIIQCHQRKYKSARRNKHGRFSQYIFVGLPVCARDTRWSGTESLPLGRKHILVLNSLWGGAICPSCRIPNLNPMFCNKFPNCQILALVRSVQYFFSFSFCVCVGGGGGMLSHRKHARQKGCRLDSWKSCIYISVFFTSSWLCMPVDGNGLVAPLWVFCCKDLSRVPVLSTWVSLLLLGGFLMFGSLTLLCHHHLQFVTAVKHLLLWLDCAEA